MAPDGKTVWVVSTTGEEETTADNTVTPVNVATDQPGPSLRTSGWLNLQDPPSAAAISPDSQTLYIAVRNGLETFHVSLCTRRKSLTPQTFTTRDAARSPPGQRAQASSDRQHSGDRDARRRPPSSCGYPHPRVTSQPQRAVAR